MKKHGEGPLDMWSLSVDSAKTLAKASEEKKNDDACDMVITNAIHTLKDPLGSSQDFVRLNNKDSLNSKLQFGDKNDGAECISSLEKLTSKIKDILENVETIGATLDKVTVAGQSYTVIVTYFF